MLSASKLDDIVTFCDMIGVAGDRTKEMKAVAFGKTLEVTAANLETLVEKMWNVLAVAYDTSFPPDGDRR